jgi:hypothetical protein
MVASPPAYLSTITSLLRQDIKDASLFIYREKTELEKRIMACWLRLWSVGILAGGILTTVYALPLIGCNHAVLVVAGMIASLIGFEISQMTCNYTERLNQAKEEPKVRSIDSRLTLAFRRFLDLFSSRQREEMPPEKEQELEKRQFYVIEGTLFPAFWLYVFKRMQLTFS